MIVLSPDSTGLARAAALLRDHKPVAFPTETVYGLGALALDPTGIAAIFAAKDRPPDNPLIVHVADVDGIDEVASSFPDAAHRLAERFWPGPLTLVLSRRTEVPAIVSAGLPTVAVRQPAHPVALAFLRAAGASIAAPSANRSGRPSPTTTAHVRLDLEGRIEAVIDGGSCTVGVESTVLDLSTPIPRLLRPGGVSREAIAEVLGLLPELAAADTPASSPGMKHRHYRPFCEVRLYDGAPPIPRPDEGLVLFASSSFTADSAAAKNAESAAFLRTVDSPESYARELFAILRDADAAHVRVLHLPWPPADGIGLALRDRLSRAAAS